MSYYAGYNITTRNGKKLRFSVNGTSPKNVQNKAYWLGYALCEGNDSPKLSRGTRPAKGKAVASEHRPVYDISLAELQRSVESLSDSELKQKLIGWGKL